LASIDGQETSVQTGNSTGGSPSTPPLRVLFIHDAAIDDFVATMLLVSMPGVDLRGIVIAGADCVPGAGMDAASRLQQFVGRPDIPLALSEARGWNPFPWQYRGDCVSFASKTDLATYSSTVPTPPPSGNALIERLLESAVASAEPLTILLTTAFTPLIDVIRTRPDLAAGIDQIVWMGGAINVAGNLDPSTLVPGVANAHAEWNVFWDPFAVHDALQMFEGIRIFPLDITNSVPLAKSFLQTLQNQAATSRFSKLASQGYALVSSYPFYDAWDVCATVWLARPDLYTPAQDMPLEVEQWGSNQGWLKASTTAARRQHVHMSLNNIQGLYDYVAAQLARPS
jgi:purine nucleosidase